MHSFSDRFEYTRPQDEYYDYCLWEYQTAGLSSRGFRSVNMLFDSLEYAGADPKWSALIAALQESIGRFRTVFGIKLDQGRLLWEFYFYDYAKKSRQRSMSRIIEAMQPFTACTIQPPENLPYFMFSIDVDDELITGRRTLDEIHMYMEHPGSKYASGVCYSLTKDKTMLENIYFFFNAKNQMKDVLQKLGCSAFCDWEHIDLKRVLWPEMQGCRVVVLAHKQGNDSVYFSRVNIDQLIFFLRKMEYPHRIRSFFKRNAKRLGHLLYDVSFDYIMHHGDLKILKSGYYGYF